MNESIQSIINAGSGLISESEVSEAREAGLLIHHEVEHQDFDGEVLVMIDDWYASTEEFVQKYYASGGTWNYS